MYCAQQVRIPTQAQLHCYIPSKPHLAQESWPMTPTTFRLLERVWSGYETSSQAHANWLLKPSSGIKYDGIYGIEWHTCKIEAVQYELELSGIYWCTLDGYIDHGGHRLTSVGMYNHWQVSSKQILLQHAHMGWVGLQWLDNLVTLHCCTHSNCCIVAHWTHCKQLGGRPSL